jgi:hypothetical protein
MKPRTKKEVEIMKLHEKLPPINERQKSWAFAHCFDKIGYVCKDEVWCTCCGKIFSKKIHELSVSLGVDNQKVCPFCGEKLTLKVSTRRKIEEDVYFTMLTTIGGMQVARHYVASKRMWKCIGTIHQCQEAQYSISEVVQIWMDENGRKHVVARSRMAYMGGGYKWNGRSAMEIRKQNYQGYHPGCYDIDGVLYPIKRVIPVLRRNGWDGHEFSCMMDTFSVLLRSSHAETLMKTKQYELLDWMGKYGITRLTEWDSVKIAIRNGYFVKDVTLWRDMVRALRNLGKDVRNKKYVCPENLKDAHDYWCGVLERKKKKEAEDKKRMDKLYWEDRYKKEKGRFFGLEITNGRVTIQTIQSVAEMQEEGDRMHHCVASNEYYKKKDSLILSARDEHGERLETIEVDLNRMKVAQCYGKFNSITERHDEILELINNNMGVIIHCKNKNYEKHEFE